MIGDYLQVYTFENLMATALSHVPDSIDKREGSIIYDALAPACYVLSDTYEKFREMLIETYVSTAHGDYLELRCSELGIDRYKATYAIRRGDFEYTDGSPAVVAIGSRFSTIVEADSLNYYVDSNYVDENNAVVPGAYNLICEELGTQGNSYSGSILPITNINNLGVATLTTVLTPARDDETDDELRERYYEAIRSRAFGGNVVQYKQWLKAISGVGEAQVYPVWDGGGTVKVSVVSADYTIISQEFISDIQEQIDPTPQGEGIGTAPIGHVVTVVTPTPLDINVAANITPSALYTVAQLREVIVEAISNYLLELRREWGIGNDLNVYSLAVYIARITAAILTVAGVENVTNITINGEAEDLALTQNSTLQQLPMLGTVTLNE